MIPDAFARSTIEREGEAGEAWLADLPTLVDDLLTRWGCEPDGAIMHGQVGVIVPVRRAGGSAVLKVSFPHPGNVHEPEAFVAWGGRGAVLLYERDDDRFAMLLERARTARLADLDDGDEIAVTAGQLSRRLSIPAPAGLPRLQDCADTWAEEIRAGAKEFPDALPGELVDAALAVVDELGRDQPDLLVHGDLHPRNILRGEREPWLAVDPKGRVGDPAYDASMLFRARASALRGTADPVTALRREMDVFADAAELEPERVRRWARFQLVQASYWGRRRGFGIARGGPELRRALTFVDQLAVSWR